MAILAVLFALLVALGVAAAWWSNDAIDDRRHAAAAKVIRASLDDRIVALQQLLTLTLPIYLSDQGELIKALGAAAKLTSFEAPNLLPAFNGWNSLLGQHLSRITVCDKAGYAVHWVGAAGVSSAFAAGDACAGAWLKEAAAAYVKNPKTAHVRSGVVELAGRFYARQYAFVQAMNPDTFENEITTILAIDQDISPVLADLVKTFGLTAALAKPGTAEPRYTVQDTYLITTATLTDPTDAVSAHVELQSDIATEQQSRRWSLIYEGTCAALLLGLVGTVVVMVLHFKVFKPLAALSRAAALLNEMEDANQIPFAGRTDEIGELAKGLKTAITAVANKRAAEQKAAAANRAAEAEREASALATKAIATQQANVVQALAAALDAMAAGDLSCRLTQVFPDEYEQLRADFNRASEQLEAALATVVVTAQIIRTQSGDITAAADDLLQRTDMQATALLQTAEAIEEVTTTVQQTASRARDASQLVQAAQSQATQSRAVVSEMVDAMAGIAGSSAQISDIIGVIDEIAFQTNLLALNAGVEAARAGDAGRGFAVVASEVRALAQRSAESAKQIKSLISQSARQVQAGVTLVDATGNALVRISSTVSAITEFVSQIADATTEQSAAISRVHTSMSQMDQVTQQNSELVGQSSAASHALDEKASELHHLVGRFNVSGFAVAMRA